MRNLSPLNTDDQSGLVVALYGQHQIFHSYLDKLVLNHQDLGTIDVLIAVRSMNLDCLNKYTDLISKNLNYKSRPAEKQEPKTRFQVTDMTLWNIHAQLARLVPFYAAAMRNESLNQVARTIISHNYDQIIKMKENLLHPVKEQIAVA